MIDVLLLYKMEWLYRENNCLLSPTGLLVTASGELFHNHLYQGKVS